LLAPKSRTIKDAHDDEIQSDVLWMGHSGENNFKRTIILKVAAVRQQRTAAISNALGMIAETKTWRIAYVREALVARTSCAFAGNVRGSPAGSRPGRAAIRGRLY
jgi:hypothetical protein